MILAQVTCTLSIVLTIVAMVINSVLIKEVRPDRLTRPMIWIFLICVSLFAGMLN